MLRCSASGGSSSSTSFQSLSKIFVPIRPARMPPRTLIGRNRNSSGNRDLGFGGGLFRRFSLVLSHRQTAAEDLVAKLVVCGHQMTRRAR